MSARRAKDLKKLRQLNQKLIDAAVEYLHDLVRDEFERDETLVEFSMGMGTWFFVDNMGDYVDEIPAIVDLMSEFADLKLSGEAITWTR